jgi:hypothetical protein
VATHEASAPSNLGAYRKAVAHILGAAVAAVMPLLGATTRPTPVQELQVGIGILGAVLTYLVPNLPTGPARYLKVTVAFLAAAASAAVPVVDGGWGELAGASLLIVLVHALTAVGVFIVPNETPGLHVVPVAEGGSPADLDGTPVDSPLDEDSTIVRD